MLDVMKVGGAAGVLVGAAGPVAEWVHSVAGTAGDIGVLIAVGTALGALGRKVWRATSKAWEGIEEIKTNTSAVPSIDEKLDAHIVETSERFASIEGTLRAYAERRRA